MIPEHDHSRLLFAPDTGSGGGSGGANRQTSDERGQTPGSQDFRLPVEAESDLSGLPGAETPRKSLFPEAAVVESEQHPNDAFQSPRRDNLESRRAMWDATGYVPRIVGGAPNNQTETPKRENDDDDSEEEPGTKGPPGRNDLAYLDLGLNRDKDLSHAANWLVERLLAGAHDYGEELDYLQWRADKEGIDL